MASNIAERGSDQGNFLIRQHKVAKYRSRLEILWSVCETSDGINAYRVFDGECLKNWRRWALMIRSDGR